MLHGIRQWLSQDLDLKYPEKKLRLGRIHSTWLLLKLYSGYFSRLRDVIYRQGFDPHRRPLIAPSELEW